MAPELRGPRQAWAAAALALAAWTVAGSGALRSQEDPGAAPDSLLTYEREVFDYPDGARPDPFRPPGATDGIGPLFEDLRLSGVLYGPSVGSVAVVRDAATGRIHRLREGDRIGRARLVEVRPSEALFVVTGPAGARRELLRVAPDRERRP